MSSLADRLVRVREAALLTVLVTGAAFASSPDSEDPALRAEKMRAALIKKGYTSAQADAAICQKGIYCANPDPELKKLGKKKADDGAETEAPAASASASSPEGGAPSSANETESRAAETRAQEAMTRSAGKATRSAASIADRLRQLAPDLSGESGVEEKPGASSAAPSRRTAAPDADLALAAISGHKAAFDAMGLRATRDASGELRILRTDGSHASEAEVARLRETVATQPAALQKQPDFFRHISRERFSMLKEDFQAHGPAHTSVFRDVSLTPDDRDFSWNRSCSRVSGECNPYASEGSYRKGEFVPSRDLNGMSNALHEEEIEAEEEDELARSAWTEAEEADLRAELAAERSLARGDHARSARTLLQELAFRLGFGDAASTAEMGDDSLAVASGGRAQAGRAPGADASRRGRAARGGITEMPERQPLPARSRVRKSAWMLLAAVGAAALVLGLRGTRGDD